MTFIVYSKDGCPYCTKIAQVLQLAECKHVIYKLNRDYTRSEFYQKFGDGSTFPQVVYESDQDLFAGEANLGGCTETIKFLREKKLV